MKNYNFKIVAQSKSRVSIDGFLRKLGKVSKCLRKACAKSGCDEGRSMRHDWRIACEANVEQAGDEGSCRGMKRKGKKACGEGDGRWRRLYSFTRSFIVRTHRLGGLQSLWLIQNSRHDRRVYVYVFFFFFVPSSCPCTLALVVVVVHRHRHRHRRGNPLLVVFVLLLAVDWWLVSERRE